MVTNQIGVLFKQAITTFTCKKDIFHQNLEILKSILDKTTAGDVDLHPQFMTNALWARQNKAPVTYIDIYEGTAMSLGIFILKPGMMLPLHDHPQMFGLLKVIAGKVKITSFSLHTEKTSKVEDKKIQHPYNTFPMILTAELNTDVILDSTSEACLLDPNKGNLHEIESIDGPAAFIDILAPPYETEIVGYGPRKCSYFRIIREIEPKVFKLEEISAPTWFWSDTHPYTGPKLVI